MAGLPTYVVSGGVRPRVESFSPPDREPRPSTPAGGVVSGVASPADAAIGSEAILISRPTPSLNHLPTYVIRRGDGEVTSVSPISVDDRQLYVFKPHFSAAVPLRYVALRLPNGRKLVVGHSPHERCGIAEYGRQLDEALVDEGAVHLGGASSEAAGEGDILLVHYEPGIAPRDLPKILEAARERRALPALCCHYFARESLAIPAGVFIVHRAYAGVEDRRLRAIPLGCPIYVPPDESRIALRRRLGLPIDAEILTTLGFFVGWKRFPDVVAAVLERASSDAHVQMICPPPFNHRDVIEEGRMSELIRARFDGRVTWIQGFIPERELLDRVRASDLGFRYTPDDTGSVSAATKQFISARRAVVVSGSNHTSDIVEGIARVASLDVGEFASEVARLAGSLGEMVRLEAGAEREYARLNMREVARRYVALFDEDWSVWRGGEAKP